MIRAMCGAMVNQSAFGLFRVGRIRRGGINVIKARELELLKRAIKAVAIREHQAKYSITALHIESNGPTASMSRYGPLVSQIASELDMVRDRAYRLLCKHEKAGQLVKHKSFQGACTRWWYPGLENELAEIDTKV